MKAIAINKAHYPVTVLGYGRRIGIWLQGCSIQCADCISRDTWTNDLSRNIPIADLVSWCRTVAHGGVDGITISGGEPFEQSTALLALLVELRHWTQQLENEVDYLCYTGLPRRVVQARHANVLSLLDALIPEPFVSGLAPRPLRGSLNQPLILLTELARARYANLYLREGVVGNGFQVAVDGQSIWLVGIPGRGDMERVVSLCAERGLSLNNPSWRA